MLDSEPQIATIKTAPLNIMVIFGAGGDLTRRMQDAEAFRAQLDSGSREFIDDNVDESHWRQMLQCVHYICRWSTLSAHIYNARRAGSAG